MMKTGDKVRITKCDVCPKVVGKMGTVIKLNTEVSSVEVKFGKGRPQKNRPNTFACNDVVLIEE